MSVNSGKNSPAHASIGPGGGRGAHEAEKRIAGIQEGQPANLGKWKRGCHGNPAGNKGVKVASASQFRAAQGHSQSPEH